MRARLLEMAALLLYLLFHRPRAYVASRWDRPPTALLSASGEQLVLSEVSDGGGQALRLRLTGPVVHVTVGPHGATRRTLPGLTLTWAAPDPEVAARLLTWRVAATELEFVLRAPLVAGQADPEKMTLELTDGARAVAVA
jgi:hypothetical protein